MQLSSGNSEMFTSSSTITVMTPQKLSGIIQEMVEERDLSYMEAVVEYCEKNDFEIEKIKMILTPSIIESINTEATKLNLLKKTKTRTLGI